MSAVDHARGADADDVLITRVRGGDLDAYGVLFERHRAAALRLARSLSNGPDADDLVADAFSKVLATLQKGGGPDLAFRAYLLTAVRRLHVDRIRAQSRATPTDDISAFDKGEPFSDTAVAAFENGAAARAFKSLPERWQMVLWHLEVERQKPAEIAPLLGMSPNAVAALAYRAREGLRQAFVQMHATGPADAADAATGQVDERCREVREQLGSYVRQGLSRRDSAKVEEHLEGCRPCTAVYLELTEVNSSLGAVIGPIVLGGAAAAYLGSTAGGGAALAGIGVLVGRIRDFVAANTTTVAVGTAATVAVAAGVGGYAATHHGGDQGPANTAAAAVPTGSAPARKAPAPARKSPGAAPTSPAGSPTAGPAAPATAAQTTAQATVQTPLQSPTAGTTGGPTGGATQSPSGSFTATASQSPSGSATTYAPVAHPLALTGPGRALGTATIRVTGFSAGESGTVTLDLPSAVGLWIISGCAPSGRTPTCPVSASDPTIRIQYLGVHEATVTASFTPAAGVRDTSDGDDAISVTMRGVVTRTPGGAR